MRSKMSVCAQMSRETDESKLPQYVVEFCQFAHAQMSRVADESKLPLGWLHNMLNSFAHAQ